jgi:hypothetical protein
VAVRARVAFSCSLRTRPLIESTLAHHSISTVTQFTYACLALETVCEIYRSTVVSLPTTKANPAKAGDAKPPV